MTADAEKINPELYAQTCPNCNGRSTVGYDHHPCPSCGNTNHPGVVFVPVKMKGRANENADHTH